MHIQIWMNYECINILTSRCQDTNNLTGVKKIFLEGTKRLQDDNLEEYP